MNNENLDVWCFLKPQIKQQIIEDDKRALEEKKIQQTSIILSILQIVFFTTVYAIYKLSEKIINRIAEVKKD